MHKPRIKLKSMKGITLAEILLVGFLLLLLSTAMLAILKIGIMSFRGESQKSFLRDQAWAVLDIICYEANQGVPVSSGGSAFYYPNSASAVTDYIEFNEPVFAIGYNTYQRVRYYTSGNTLYRSTNSSTVNEVAKITGGTISLRAVYKSANKVEISVTVTAGARTETVTTNVYIIGTALL